MIRILCGIGVTYVTALLVFSSVVAWAWARVHSEESVVGLRLRYKYRWFWFAAAEPVAEGDIWRRREGTPKTACSAPRTAGPPGLTSRTSRRMMSSGPSNPDGAELTPAGVVAKGRARTGGRHSCRWRPLRRRPQWRCRCGRASTGRRKRRRRKQRRAGGCRRTSTWRGRRGGAAGRRGRFWKGRGGR